MNRPQEFIIINNDELRRSVLSAPVLDLIQPCILSSFPSSLFFISPSLLCPSPTFFFLLSFRPSYLPSSLPSSIASSSPSLFLPPSFLFSLSCLSPDPHAICPLSSYHNLKTMLVTKLSFSFGIPDLIPVP